MHGPAALQLDGWFWFTFVLLFGTPPGPERVMNELHINRVAAELKLRPGQVQSTARLVTDGATVLFIGRYRKEAPGMLDEVAIGTIRDRLSQLAELDARR